jgi:[acyl-carrier-protein] S-malonyltransferase
MPDSTVAWVFPGQGSQESGMGRDLYDAYPASRKLYDRADAVLGRSISSLCFEGPAEELGKTFNSQPAIYVTSLACLAAARASGALSGDPAFMAGHSLGEYSALTAAGALDFEAGVRLVETRGRITHAAAEAMPGSMAAIMGLDEPTTEAVCRDAGAELCNINSPAQIVIGGTTDAIAKACALAIERGAKRAIPLDVSGAFHTSLMQPAVAAMAEAVAAAGIVTPRVPVVTNDTARATSDALVIAAELAFQLTHPVRWVQCVEYMAANGVTEFVEIGPGKVLSGLIKRIVPGVQTKNINDARSLA